MSNKGNRLKQIKKQKERSYETLEKKNIETLYAMAHVLI